MRHTRVYACGFIERASSARFRPVSTPTVLVPVSILNTQLPTSGRALPDARASGVEIWPSPRRGRRVASQPRPLGQTMTRTVNGRGRHQNLGEDLDQRARIHAPPPAASSSVMSVLRGTAAGPCPVPLTVRGTQALVSFAPLAFKLFCAARQNAVLRRSPFRPV